MTPFPPPNRSADCVATSDGADADLVDLAPLNILRRPSGLCADDEMDRLMDRDYAGYRVWLDRLIDARQRLIADGADPKGDHIKRYDNAITGAVITLHIGGEDPGPLPIVITDLEGAPSPIVTLDEVLKTMDEVPHSYVKPNPPKTDE